jgi:hypothetical protein
MKYLLMTESYMDDYIYDKMLTKQLITDEGRTSGCVMDLETAHELAKDMAQLDNSAIVYVFQPVMKIRINPDVESGWGVPTVNLGEDELAAFVQNAVAGVVAAKTTKKRSRK